MATLTYAYADRAVVLGPLATYAEPHTYDLCLTHAERMTAPRGWDVVRVGEFSEPAPVTDDLLALADAVREVAPFRRSALSVSAAPTVPTVPAARGVTPRRTAASEAATESGSGVVEAGRRGHLRILRDT